MKKRIPERKWREIVSLVPSLATDGVLIDNGKILLVKRGHEPFKGTWALPGGFVDNYERVARACEREMFEETGIKSRAVRLIGVYDDPKRDPRGHVISISYLLEKKSGKLKPSSETPDVRFFPLSKLPEMATDHKTIIKDALKQLRRSE